MTNINYKLVQPERVISQGSAWGVVLPTEGTNLTVIAGQSPSIVGFGDGLFKVLNESGKIVNKYFVRSGVATIVNDTCVVASEQVFAKADLDRDDVLKRAATDPFYEMVAIEMSAD